MELDDALTMRAVRKRLDLDRPVERPVVAGVRAGGNGSGWSP